MFKPITIVWYALFLTICSCDIISTIKVVIFLARKLNFFLSWCCTSLISGWQSDSNGNKHSEIIINTCFGSNAQFTMLCGTITRDIECITNQILNGYLEISPSSKCTAINDVDILYFCIYFEYQCFASFPLVVSFETDAFFIVYKQYKLM